jgi:hypothetical protein
MLAKNLMKGLKMLTLDFNVKIIMMKLLFLGNLLEVSNNIKSNLYYIYFF